MKRQIWIIGAGFSKSFGLPLYSEWKNDFETTLNNYFKFGFKSGPTFNQDFRVLLRNKWKIFDEKNNIKYIQEPLNRDIQSNIQKSKCLKYYDLESTKKIKDIAEKYYNFFKLNNNYTTDDFLNSKILDDSQLAIIYKKLLFNKSFRKICKMNKLECEDKFDNSFLKKILFREIDHIYTFNYDTILELYFKHILHDDYNEYKNSVHHIYSEILFDENKENTVWNYIYYKNYIYENNYLSGESWKMMTSPKEYLPLKNTKKYYQNNNLQKENEINWNKMKNRNIIICGFGFGDINVSKLHLNELFNDNLLLSNNLNIIIIEPNLTTKELNKKFNYLFNNHRNFKNIQDGIKKRLNKTEDIQESYVGYTNYKFMHIKEKIEEILKDTWDSKINI